MRRIHCPVCGNSSVGRARPCQGRGREFESRFPLQILKPSVKKFPLGFSLLNGHNCFRIFTVTGNILFGRRVTGTYVAGWQSGYAAACKAVYPGSIPGSAST
jgi:hypothetical protein